MHVQKHTHVHQIDPTVMAGKVYVMGLHTQVKVYLADMAGKVYVMGLHTQVKVYLADMAVCIILTRLQQTNTRAPQHISRVTSLVGNGATCIHTQ